VDVKNVIFSDRTLYSSLEVKFASTACCLLHAGFLLDLLFNPKDGGDMFLRNVVISLSTATRRYITKVK
jgi:hypothetical protein